MKVSIALPAMAPQPTGHPASLPRDPVAPAPDRKVMPTGAGSGSDETRARDFAARPEDQTAPPSAIQRKIMEMLEQQAQDLAERDEKPEE